MSLKLKPVFVLLSLNIFLMFSDATNPEVDTALGRIKGSYMYSALKRRFFSFRGVKYAESPEGERRFQIAEPVHAWSGVFDASEEGPACPVIAPEAFTSEDCLRVNIYTSKLPNANEKVKRPVIVFFHPGAFYGYSAQSNVFGPEYYMDHDIVLVTVAYRLGTFGFTSTGDARSPGNLGLKDQVYALRWVQKYISSFGGDPNSVTIAGYSAGSVSVILHMVSPMSKGLFHRAIASSASPEMRQPMPTQETNVLLQQAKFVGCPYDDVDKALECLKKTPYLKITETWPKFFESNGVSVWNPVVEPEVPGVERFLPGHAADLIRLGKINSVPLITGINRDEFLGSALAPLEAAMKGNDTAFRDWTENWDTLAPINFLYERDTERSKNISHELRKFYFNDEPITVKNGKTLGLVYSDGIIGFPMQRAAQLMAQYSKAPVYRYMFTYQGRFSYSVWSDTKKPIGVVHQDDLLYLMTTKFAFPVFNETDPEFPTVRKMTAMWTNFAKTGEPIPKNNDLFKGVTWTPLDPKKENYLEIGEEFARKNKMYYERYALWERLFPLKPIEQ